MKRLLVYYGWPSLINRVAHSGAVPLGPASQFSKYDAVVLGAHLELRQHPDHENTVQIVRCLDSAVYGYIDLGMTTSGYMFDELSRRITRWKDTGVAGIFYDDAGRDFGVEPGRLGMAVTLAHDDGLAVCANCWNPEDLRGSGLAVGDSYLAESWRIRNGRRDIGWKRRTRRIQRVQQRLGFQVWALPTGPYSRPRFDRAHRAAESAGFGVFGWGEPNYCADSFAPDRFREVTL